MFLNSKFACAKIIEEIPQAKGGYSAGYVFEVDGKKVKGNVPYSSLKSISLDSLKKIECVKIEYSNYSTFFNRVIDNRILK